MSKTGAEPFITNLREKAAKSNKHIVFPEGSEERTIQAAGHLVDKRICSVTLLGDAGELKQKAHKLEVSLKDIQIVDPKKSSNLEIFNKQFFELRKHKGITEEEARSAVINPLFYAAMMVRNGEADGSVAGAQNTTGNVLRAGIQCIGLADDISVVSSTFLMIVPEWPQVLTFADAGVVPDPDPEQLVSIAMSSAKTHTLLTGNEPVVAMLSFSTYGSASHPLVEKVKTATQILKERAPHLNADGEIQADTALVPAVAEKKAPGSSVAGNANVLIFPNLDAGNIAYKLTQRLAKATALGPLIQGLRKPAMDLSRGCSVEDIIDVASICCIMANA